MREKLSIKINYELLSSEKDIMLILSKPGIHTQNR